MEKKKNNKNIFDDFGIKATFDGSAVILNSNDFPQQGNKGCSENSWGTARFAKDDEFTEDWEDNEGFDTDSWLDFDNSVSNNPGVSHQEPFPGDLGFQPAYDTPWLNFGDNTDNNQIDCYDIQEYIIDHGFYLDNTNKVVYLLDLPHVYKDMILTRTNKENKGYKVVFCVLDVFDIAAFEGTDMYLSFKEVPQVQSLIQGYIDAFMSIEGV